jgi:hypothetical protein
MSSFRSRGRLLAGSILSGVVLSGVVLAALTVAAAAQVPNFGAAKEVGWVGIGGEFLPAPGPGPKPNTFDPKYPYVPNNTGAQPTYRIADLTHPNLKPWVKERMKKDNDEIIAGKIGFTARSSCKMAGVPAFWGYGGPSPFYFVQTPKQVWMIFSGDQQVRRIYLDVPHSENPKPSWYGESVGRYDGGDTLVVDTIGLTDKTFVDNYRTPHTTKMRVVERYKLIENGAQMEMKFTVEDPEAFYEPWSAIRRFRRVTQDYREEVCAEGNRMLFDYNIPKAETADF